MVQIYWRQYIQNFIRIGQVLWKIWQNILVFFQFTVYRITHNAPAKRRHGGQLAVTGGGSVAELVQQIKPARLAFGRTTILQSVSYTYNTMVCEFPQRWALQTAIPFFTLLYFTTRRLHTLPKLLAHDRTAFMKSFKLVKRMSPWQKG